jgi:mono/diheme cytochrome c family protein
LLVAALAHSATTEPATQPSVSFSRDVQLLLNQNCISCHRPEKHKGKLDLTSFAAIEAGGKNGDVVTPGKPAESPLVTMVGGDHPEMPDKGDPLTSAQVAVLARWVEQGAKDDTPPGSRPIIATTPSLPEKPPMYVVAPAISAIAWSPDGQTLLVAGYHEVLLHHADGSGLIARLPSRVARITSLSFSTDATQLLAAGGTPGGAGQLDVWKWDSRELVHSFTIPNGDTLFGATFSLDTSRIAFGCVDKTVRVISTADGKEQFKFDVHTDWVLGATFTLDGSRLISAGRDKSLKTFPLASTQPADEVNDPVDPFTCLARHPSQDLVACGCDTGTIRIYKITDLLQRTDQKRDPNQVKQLDRQPGAINAVAFSADGKLLAAASNGNVRIYKTDNWSKAADLSGIEGPVFAVAFSPDGTRVAAAGYDGQVHIFDIKTQHPEKVFIPVPLREAGIDQAR